MPDSGTPFDDQLSPVRVLSRTQRRVLGVLIEKGITTPEYYPLTLKALTAGCNQKNNRSPLTDYSEEDVQRAVDQLRELGLAAVVHTESGRSERYRHYVRKRFPFNEAQLAIMTELWLRGRQSLGDLRSRASRMFDIPSLDQLRNELKSLHAQGFVQANGPLDARGVEVDHNFYKPDEGKVLTSVSVSADCDDGGSDSGLFRKNAELPLERSASTTSAGESRLEKLERSVVELANRLQAAEQSLAQLADRFEALRRELGANV